MLFYFIFLNILLMGQDKMITPPLGLTFGMRESAYKTAMLKYGTFDKAEDEAYGRSLNFLNVSIGNTKSFVFVGKFVNNKLFEVVVGYNDDITEIEERYKDICSIISSKYGQGKSFRNFKYPYEDKEEDFELAVRSGHADIVTYWGTYETNEISVEINKIPAVSITYQSTTLVEEAVKKVDNNNSSQF
jgi:hypothetical protein